MGLFDSIGNRWSRRQLKKGFSKYVDPAVIDEILDGSIPKNEMRRCNIDFILALIRDDDLANIQTLLCKVTDAIHNTGGFLEQLAGPLILVTFGALPDKTTPSENARHRLEAVARFGGIGKEIKVLHGRAAALVGTFGSQRNGHFVYGTVIQEFSGFLRALTQMEFGEMREF